MTCRIYYMKIDKILIRQSSAALEYYAVPERLTYLITISHVAAFDSLSE